MLQVAQTGVFDKHSSTIIILVQWTWTELSQHPRRDLNSRCAFVYALSPNFSGKLVVSAVLQSELSLMLSLLITWGWLQRPVCDTTVAAHKFWVRGEDWGTQETCAKGWHVSALDNHLSHRCCKLSAGSQAVRTWGLFCICLQSFKVTFWEIVWCVWLVEVDVCVCISCFTEIFQQAKCICYLHRHICSIRWSAGVKSTQKHIHPRIHPPTNIHTHRPINLLFDSGLNLLSATPLAGPASQFSSNKEARDSWRGSNRQSMHHKTCLSLL